MNSRRSQEKITISDVMELISEQIEIIKKQAGIIDRLLLLLLQHVEVEDMENELREVTNIASQWNK